MTGMDEALRRIWEDAAARLDADLPPGIRLEVDTTPLVVTKYSGYLVASDDVLMDAGAIPDTRPPVRTPWHRRLRWRWQAWRERAGRKVGGWIAGVDLSERDW